MAALTGTVTAASLMMEANGAKKLHIELVVDVGANTIAVTDNTTLAPSCPQIPSNLAGRVVTVNTDGSNELLTNTGIVIT